MDLLSIATSLMSGSNKIVSTVAKQTGEKKNDITDVLGSALPQLIGKIGSSQTTVIEKKEDNNLLSTLLGGANKATAFLDDIAKKLGLSSQQVMSIIVAALPLVIEAISNLTSTDTSKEKKTTKKTSTAKKTSTKKKTSTTKKTSKKDDGLDIGSLASSLLGGSSKKTDASDLLGDIVSGLLKK